MPTSFADRIIKARFSNIWDTSTEALERRLANRDWEYDDPALRRRTILSTRDLDAMYALSRDFYKGADDPSSEIQKDQLAEIFHNINPVMSKSAYKNNLEDMFYRTTGYRTDVNGMWEHLGNTFRASGSSFLAGIKTFSNYIAGMFDTDEEFAKRMEELDIELSRYANTYRDDIYDSNIFVDAATEAARILPSMLPTIGITGLVALTSVLSGGATAGALGLSASKLLGVWGTLNTASKVAGASTIGARFLTSAIMEAGGTALELHQAGFDPGVVRSVSTVVGLVNGIWEGVGDSFGNSLDRLVSAPLASLGKHFGRSTTNDAVKYSLKQIFRERRKEYLKSLATEPLTEAVQELSSMLGYNVAVYLQNKTGRPLEDVIGYSVSDITKAMGDTAVATFKGTLVLGASSTALGMFGSSIGGDIRTALNLSPNVEFEGATAMASPKNVTILGAVAKADSIKSDTKVAPVPVVKIGGKYYTYGASPEQNAIARSSKAFYVKEQTIDASMKDAVFSNSSLKRSTINNTIATSLRQNRLEGFTYLDADNRKVSSIEEAVKVAIQPKGGKTTVFNIDDNSRTEQQEAERTAFGENLTRSFTKEELEERIANLEKERQTAEDQKKTDEDVKTEQKKTTEDEPAPQSTDDTTITEKKTDNPIEKAVKRSEKKAEDAQKLSEKIDEAINRYGNVDKIASSILDPIKEQKEQAKAEREQERKRKADRDFVKALGELNASDQEIDEIAKALPILADVYKDTDIAKADGSIQSARTAAIAMAGFAHAQGKTFKEFYDGLKIGKSSGASEAGTQNNSNNIGGWYRNGEIEITDNATPTTLSHEISHHFLSTLQDGDVKNRILETYKTEYEKDGNAIGTNLQEAFASDFEQYIYFNKAKNKEIGKVFAELKRICSRIWKFFTDKSTLSADKIALFDSILGEEDKTEIATGVSDGVNTIEEETKNDINPQESMVEKVEQSIKEIQEAEGKDVIITEENVKETANDIVDTLKDSTPENKVDETVSETTPETVVSEVKDSIEQAVNTTENTPYKKPVMIAYTDKNTNVLKVGVSSGTHNIVNENNSDIIDVVNTAVGAGNTVLKNDVKIDELLSIKSSKLTNSIAKLSRKVDVEYNWKFYQDTTYGNVYAVSSDKRSIIVIPSTLTNGSVPDTVNAVAISEIYADLSDDLYNKTFFFDDDESEYVQEEFLLSKKPLYDYRILADAFLLNMATQDSSEDKTYYQTVDRDTTEDFASFIIESKLSSVIDKIVSDFKESGSTDIVDYVKNSREVLEQLEGFDENAKAKLSDSIARQIKSYSESYAPAMNVLASAVRNKKNLPKAMNLIQDMIDAVLSRMNKPSRFWDNMNKYFMATEDSTEADKSVNIAWRLFVNTMNGNGKMSEDDARTLISGMVNRDGRPARIAKEGKYGYRSFITDLVDAYAYSSTLAENEKSDTIVSNTMERASRQEILSYQIDDASIADNFDAGLYPLMMEIAHANIDGAMSSMFNGYVDSRLSEAVSEEFTKNYDKLQSTLSKLDEKRNKLKDLQKRYNELISKIEEIQKENRKYVNRTEAQLAKDQKRIAEIVEELKKVKEEADQISQENITLSITLDEIRQVKEKLEAEKIQQARKSAEKSMLNTALYRGDARWNDILSKAIASISKKRNIGKKLDANAYTTIWPGHVKYLERMIDAFYKAKIIGVGDKGTITQLRRLQDLSETEFAVFKNNIDRISESVGNDRKKRLQDHHDRRDSFEDGIVSDLRRFKEQYDENEWNDFISQYKKTFHFDSNEERAERKPSRLPSVEFIQMANSMESFSPALYAYFFGGSINGERVENNLNSATNAELIKSRERINAFYKAGADAFGLDEKTFKKNMNKLFLGNDFEMGKVDYQSFVKSSRGKAILADPRFEALKTRIENIEEARERASKRYDSQLEALDESGIEGKAYDDMLFKIELEYKLAEAKYDREVNGTDSTPTYVMDTAMGVYIYSQQTDGLSGLISSTTDDMNGNLSISQILYTVDQFLNNDELRSYQELADYMISDMSSRFFDLSDAYYNTTGKVLKQVSNYFVIRRYIENDADALMPEWNNLTPNDLEARDRSTKERAPQSRAPLILGVASAYASSIRECEHYIAFAELMKDYAHLLKHGSKFNTAFRAVTKDLGVNGREIMDGYYRNLRIISRGTAVNTEATNGMSRLIRTMRNNFSRSVLWGSLTALGNVFVSLPVTVTESGGRRLIEAVFSYMGSRSDIDNFVYEHSEQMRNRASLEFDELTRNREYGKITEALSKIVGKEGAQSMADGFRWFSNLWFELMQKMDTRIANISWYAIYNNLVANYDGEITADVETMLSEQATQKTLNIMPSHNAKDNALIYSSPDNAVKQALLFTSQMNKQFNILWSGVKDVTGHKGLKNIKDWQFERLGALFEDFAMLALATAAASLVSGEAWPDGEDDDDGFWINLLHGTGVESLSMIPVIGSTLRDIATGNVYTDTGMAGSFINMFRVLSKDESDRTDHQLGNSIMHSLSSVGQLTGLPYNILYKPYQWWKNGPELENVGYLINSRWGSFLEDVI